MLQGMKIGQTLKSGF